MPFPKVSLKMRVAFEALGASLTAWRVLFDSTANQVLTAKMVVEKIFLAVECDVA